MGKKYVVALMIAVVFLGGLYSIISFNNKNEAIRFDREYTWYAEYDAEKSLEVLVRGAKIEHIRKDVNQLVLALNKATELSETVQAQGETAAPEFPKLALQRIEQGTAFVEILNAGYLTQNMGTSGAQVYLAAATYTLTENPAVAKVNFVFEEGDHAAPGEYTRESFSGNYAVATGKKR